MVKKNMNSSTHVIDDDLKNLVEKGKKRGYLTYEEMNNGLPEENISPDRLDGLLMTLDDLGIDLIDEDDLEKLEKEDIEFKYEEPLGISAEEGVRIAEELLKQKRQG